MLFVDVTGQLPPWSEDEGCWENDGLHLSPAGSRRFGELLGSNKALVRFLLEDTSISHVEPEPEAELKPPDDVVEADTRQVAYQAGVTEAVARDALARNRYDMVAAVLDLNG